MPKTSPTRRPGEIRDAIVKYLSGCKEPAKVSDIHAALEKQFGVPVARSSVRSSLNFGVDDLYERVGRGQYRLRTK